MDNTITFPDHDYPNDTITLTDDAPPADELQSLRVQVEALTLGLSRLLLAVDSMDSGYDANDLADRAMRLGWDDAWMNGDDIIKLAMDEARGLVATTARP